MENAGDDTSVVHGDIRFLEGIIGNEDCGDILHGIFYQRWDFIPFFARKVMSLA